METNEELLFKQTNFKMKKEQQEVYKVLKKLGLSVEMLK
jgi:hypothetical protein